MFRLSLSVDDPGRVKTRARLEGDGVAYGSVGLKDSPDAQICRAEQPTKVGPRSDGLARCSTNLIATAGYSGGQYPGWV
jgi:hypothetical protein